MNDLLRLLLPLIILLCGGTVVVLLGALLPSRHRSIVPAIALVAVLLALAASVILQGRCATYGCAIDCPSYSLRLTPPGLLAAWIALALTALLVLLAWDPDALVLADTAPTSRLRITGEYHALLLFSLTGMLLLLLANNLILLTLALELVSLPTYALVALARPHPAAREGALKYFFLGALATALTIYGFALLYGLAGSIHLDKIAAMLYTAAKPLHIIAVLLVIIGLCFKIAAVPMHFYAADVYQGAASSVAALLAFLPKFAGFFALIIIIDCLGWPLWPAPYASALAPTTGALLALLAVLTMTVGNTLALLQQNVKRILAYSSIAHTGYLMLGLLVGVDSDNPLAPNGVAAIFFYICAYAAATIAAFAILTLIRRAGDEAQQLSDLAGLARRHPALAAVLALAVLSLMGLPLTAGFTAKFYLFSALIAAPDIPYKVPLLIIALINAAIASAYYLRILAAAYLRDEPFTLELTCPAPHRLGLALAAALTIILGIAPFLLVRPLHRATTCPVAPVAAATPALRQTSPRLSGYDRSPPPAIPAYQYR